MMKLYKLLELLVLMLPSIKIAAANHWAEAAGISTQFLQSNLFDLADEFASYFNYVIKDTCFCAILPGRQPTDVESVCG